MPARRPPGEGRLIQLVYYGYLVASAVARWLPERPAYGAARLIGRLAARRPKPSVAKNLSRITGEPPDSPVVRELLVKAYQSYARYWFETFRLVREDRDFFLDRFRLEGVERLDAVLARGKGAIVVVGHLGNWDAAGAWVGATGRKLVTVAEVLKPRRMFEFFFDHRAKLGMTIHPAEPGVTRKLIKDVEEGAVVAILGDRDLKGTGPEIDFFGEPATLPAGAASIALETGVPLLVAGVYGVVRDGKPGWAGEMSEIIELPETMDRAARVELTQRVAKELERFIAARPEEWHVFQPFWKADREAARSQTRSRSPRRAAGPPEQPDAEGQTSSRSPRRAAEPPEQP